MLMKILFDAHCLRRRALPLDARFYRGTSKRIDQRELKNLKYTSV